MRERLTRREVIRGVAAASATMILAVPALVNRGTGQESSSEGKRRTEGSSDASSSNTARNEQELEPHAENTGVTYRELHDVRVFGAIGNGESDDTHAINAALAEAKQDDVVYFPAGTYRITNTISVPSHVTFAGAWMYLSTIRFTGNGPVFQVLDQSGVTFRDLSIEGNISDPQWGIGVHVKESNNITVQRCEIHSIDQHALYLESVEHFQMQHCVIHATGLTGVRLAGGPDAANRVISVHDSQFYNVVMSKVDGNSAIHADGSSFSEHVTIEGCSVDSLRIGIGLDSVEHAIVRHNRIVGHLEYGEGIALTGSHNVIEHNVINNWIAAGILVFGAQQVHNNVIQYNEVWDCAQGIAISTWFPGSDIDGVQIRGNRCYRVNGTGTEGWGDMAYGIQTYIERGVTDFTVRNISVIDNDLRGNKVGPWSMVEPYVSATYFANNLT